MATINLKKCPFCGGESKFKRGRVYLDEAVYAVCGQCGCRTRVVLIDHPRLTSDGLDESTRYTAAQAEQKAAELWNARATVND